MAKHIGVVACSAEGASLCYRTLCAEAAQLMGEHAHPEVSLHNHSLATYLEYINSCNWEEVGKLMLSSVRKLAQIGAEFAICPDNTIHQALSLIEPQSPIPWLHIVEVVAQAAQSQEFTNLGILGTRSLMAAPLYPEMLDRYDIKHQMPAAVDRERIDKIIHEQLVYGLLSETSRHYFNSVIKEFKENGCDAVVLGCTEIPLLVDPDDCPLPTLDSTRLLATAALEHALAGN